MRWNEYCKCMKIFPCKAAYVSSSEKVKRFFALISECSRRGSYFTESETLKCWEKSKGIGNSPRFI